MFMASSAALPAAIWPANGVDLRLPEIPIFPGVAQEITFP
jgi:hypothetical protein